MKDLTILTSNIICLSQIIDRLTYSPERIVSIYGVPGIGKTSAGKYYQEQQGAIYYRVFPKMTPYSLVYTLLQPFSVTPRSTVAGLNMVIDILKTSKHKAIVIDECDFLNYDCLEIIRTIHDITGIIAILIGEPKFYGVLKQHDRLFDRTTHLEFMPLDLSDAKRFVHDICQVSLSDELIATIHTYSDSNLRRFKNAVRHVESICLTAGVTHCGLDEWGTRQFSEMDDRPSFVPNPKRRRRAA